MAIDKNEIKNQHVHMFWGLILSTVLLRITHLYWMGWVFGMLIGLGVEIWQYFYADNRELKLFDRILDISSWGLGGALAAAVCAVWYTWWKI